ncbi:MAG: IS4 family transposase [Legionella sp.]|nr:IS4 family transposase [Legionella sp.]
MDNFWSPLQVIIEEICSDFDKIWQTRKRVIGTHFLVTFILKLVLSKNSQGYKILLSELWETEEFSRIQQQPVSSSSICEARQKMPEALFIQINQRILAMREDSNPLPLWRGHRVFGVDGSKINVPHELLNAGYKAPNKQQYYPQGLMSTLYHLGSGLIYDGLLSAEKGERHCLLAHMERLSMGDVLVLDRGYFSYLILIKAIEKGLHLICRMQSGTVNKRVQAFWDSDKQDEVITYKPSVAVTYESKKQGYFIEPNPIELRLIKYKIENETYVCCTMLVGEQYPLSEFPSVYHGRWGIEELYKISKEFIDVEDFHSKSERGVKQECFAHMLLINLARIFESEADNQLPPLSSGLPNAINDHKNSYWKDFCGEIKKFKLNFKNCLLVVGRSLVKLLFPGDNKDFIFLDKILKGISRVRQKIRPGRHSPRQSRKPINKWKSSSGIKVIYS